MIFHDPPQMVKDVGFPIQVWPGNSQTQRGGMINAKLILYGQKFEWITSEMRLHVASG